MRKALRSSTCSPVWIFPPDLKRTIRMPAEVTAWVGVRQRWGCKSLNRKGAKVAKHCNEKTWCAFFFALFAPPRLVSLRSHHVHVHFVRLERVGDCRVLNRNGPIFTTDGGDSPGI